MGYLLAAERIISHSMRLHLPSYSYICLASPSRPSLKIQYLLPRLIVPDRCGNRDTRRRSFGSKSWKENSCWSSGVRRILALVMVPNRPTRPQYLSLNKSVRSPRCLNHLRPIQEVDRRAEAEEGGEVQVPTLAAIEGMWNLRRRRCLLSSGYLSDHLQMMMATTT